MPKIIVIGHLLLNKVIVENVVTCFWGTQCIYCIYVENQ